MKIARFSRIGFILAAAGSAVGLGNIWKFPYVTGENGGGAFVLIYLLTVLLIGFSIMLAEILMGYLGRQDTVTAFEKLAPKNKGAWKFAGFQSFTGLTIMSFYSVVVGWIFHYVVTSFSALPSTVAQAEASFMSMLQTDALTQIFYHTLAFIFITFIILKGVKSGIEKLNLILMPTLMLILLGLFFYAITMDAFSQAVDFMFNPKWEKVNSHTFITAIGHAFFTLSLGMGAIMTYSASLEKGSSLVKSAFWVIFLDTTIAIVAGLTLFTFLYQYDSHPGQGPGLVFISLPAAFYAMGTIGNIIAILFFVALAFAGVTSSVSIVEPMVQYFIDRFKWSRLKAALAMGSFFYLLGVVAILSNIEGFKDVLTFGSKNLFDWLDFVTASILLPIAGVSISIFVGFVMDKQKIEAVLRPQLGSAFEAWYFSLRYIAPIGLFIVMLSLVGII
ncbi:MAG: NSS family neurotransmitter:Na+ symporter [Sulfurimonas sp.]|jgi:NSS family neurotransmitter:Na+ symporter